MFSVCLLLIVGVVVTSTTMFANPGKLKTEDNCYELASRTHR